MGEPTGSQRLTDIFRRPEKVESNLGRNVTRLSLLPLLLSMGMVLGHEIAEVPSLSAMATTEFVGHSLYAICHEGLAFLGGAGVAAGFALRRFA